MKIPDSFILLSIFLAFLAFSAFMQLKTPKRKIIPKR